MSNNDGDTDHWISIEEAIQLVMKSHGCSRRAARRILVKNVKDNKLPTQRTLLKDSPPGQLLDPEKAVELFESDPASVFMPLDYFAQRFDFSPDEIMGELKSGRLIASADENTRFQLEITGRAPTSQFTINGKAMISWMSNPKTPPALLAKFVRNLQQKPS